MALTGSAPRRPSFTAAAIDALGGHPVDVVDAVRRRRMHRQFEQRPVPPKILAALAWAAGRAQTARPNGRVVVVVDDPALMRTARDVLPGFGSNATAMLVIATNLEGLEASIGVRGVDHTSRLDSGAAAAHVALLAQSFGVGVCTVTSWSDAAVRSLFDLPPSVRPDVTIALGYPIADAVPAPRATHDPAVYLNSYGRPFEPSDE